MASRRPRDSGTFTPPNFGGRPRRAMAGRRALPNTPGRPLAAAVPGAQKPIRTPDAWDDQARQDNARIQGEIH